MPDKVLIGGIERDPDRRPNEGTLLILQLIREEGISLKIVDERVVILSPTGNKPHPSLVGLVSARRYTPRLLTLLEATPEGQYPLWPRITETGEVWPEDAKQFKAERRTRLVEGCLQKMKDMLGADGPDGPDGPLSLFVVKKSNYPWFSEN